MLLYTCIVIICRYFSTYTMQLNQSIYNLWYDTLVKKFFFFIKILYSCFIFVSLPLLLLLLLLLFCPEGPMSRLEKATKPIRRHQLSALSGYAQTKEKKTFFVFLRDLLSVIHNAIFTTIISPAGTEKPPLTSSYPCALDGYTRPLAGYLPNVD